MALMAYMKLGRTSFSSGHCMSELEGPLSASRAQAGSEGPDAFSTINPQVLIGEMVAPFLSLLQKTVSKALQGTF